ncbi:MAG: biotin carboxylase N-terminal domain-containing protein [Thermodesulfobacteriota bacterium]
MEDKVLIANRGEIAIRIMNACKNLGLDYVIVYTREDESSLHVKLNRDSQSNRRNAWRVSSYRDPNDILAVADHTGCTAVHPGYGFFAEDYRFARRVQTRERSLTFIGPSWEVIKVLGSKINTKSIANALKIPTIPGSDAPIYNEIEAEGLAEELFYIQEEKGIKNPSILVKASAGGGGMGIEQVAHIDQFRQVYRRIKNYAKRQFGDEGVLIEQCINGYNHLEVQLVCSKHREMVHFGTRNCTIQSLGRQKRIEVSPGFDLENPSGYQFNPQRILDEIIGYSLKLAAHVKYDNVGTWEWIVTREGHPYLLEVNTRIQVENDVSAKTSRIRGHDDPPNLIEEQIRLALGERLGYKQKDISFTGAAIEFRVVAEDTKRGFTPWIGTITGFETPAYPWLSIYSHVPHQGAYDIPSEYDPNLALAIACGGDLAEAKERGRTFLSEVKIEGRNSREEPIITNLDYLKENIDNLLIFKD